MRINNPKKFNASGTGNSEDLVSIGEVLNLTKFKYSSNNIDWHDNKEDDDIYIKGSFDGGKSYPLFFTGQMNDEIIIKSDNGELFDWPAATSSQSLAVVLSGINSCPILSAIIENDSSILIENPGHGEHEDNKAIDFIISNYINGVSLIRQEDDGYSYVETIGQISYNFIQDNHDHNGNIKLQYYFTPSEILTNRKYFLKIRLNTNKINQNMLMADFKVPIYSSNVTAIPTKLDEIYGICNYLSKGDSINCLSRFANVSRIALNVVSADSNETGNIKLGIKIGNNPEIIDTYQVTAENSWIYINNTSLYSGQISIRRFNDSNDTLNATCIILGIRVENE